MDTILEHRPEAYSCCTMPHIISLLLLLVGCDSGVSMNDINGRPYSQWRTSYLYPESFENLGTCCEQDQDTGFNRPFANKPTDHVAMDDGRFVLVNNDLAYDLEIGYEWGVTLWTFERGASSASPIKLFEE